MTYLAIALAFYALGIITGAAFKSDFDGDVFKRPWPVDPPTARARFVDAMNGRSRRT